MQLLARRYATQMLVYYLSYHIVFTVSYLASIMTKGGEALR